MANTGEPTYAIEGIASAPALDVTLTCGYLLIHNWRTAPSIGRCGHKVILYDISIDEQNSPWQSRPRTKPKATSISWRKVEWDVFNATVERLYLNHRCHSAPTISVHT